MTSAIMRYWDKSVIFHKICIHGNGRKARADEDQKSGLLCSRAQPNWPKRKTREGDGSANKWGKDLQEEVHSLGCIQFSKCTNPVLEKYMCIAVVHSASICGIYAHICGIRGAWKLIQFSASYMWDLNHLQPTLRLFMRSLLQSWKVANHSTFPAAAPRLTWEMQAGTSCDASSQMIQFWQYLFSHQPTQQLSRIACFLYWCWVAS